jgi:hypothetical protein
MSGYFAKLFACFTSVSWNVPRNSEIKKISGTSSKIEKLPDNGFSRNGLFLIHKTVKQAKRTAVRGKFPWFRISVFHETSETKHSKNGEVAIKRFAI